MRKCDSYEMEPIVQLTNANEAVVRWTIKYNFEGTIESRVFNIPILNGSNWKMRVIRDEFYVMWTFTRPALHNLQQHYNLGRNQCVNLIFECMDSNDEIIFIRVISNQEFQNGVTFGWPDIEGDNRFRNVRLQNLLRTCLTIQLVR